MKSQLKFITILVDEGDEQSITQVARVVANAMNFQREFLVFLLLVISSIIHRSIV